MAHQLTRGLAFGAAEALVGCECSVWLAVAHARSSDRKPSTQIVPRPISASAAPGDAPPGERPFADTAALSFRPTFYSVCGFSNVWQRDSQSMAVARLIRLSVL